MASTHWIPEVPHKLWQSKIFSDFVKSPCRANCSQLRSTLDLVSDTWYLFGTVVNDVVYFFFFKLYIHIYCQYVFLVSCFCCCWCEVASVVSDSVQPHRWQPTGLCRPWDSPGKNTGVGCHFLLQCMEKKSESEVTQSCQTLCDPMDCSLPGSSIYGIFQATVLEWVAIAFSVLCPEVLLNILTILKISQFQRLLCTLSLLFFF